MTLTQYLTAPTYEWVLGHEGLLERPDRWRAFYGDRPAWVFTHRDLPVPDGLDIRLVSDDVRPVHDTMRTAAAGGNAWLIGGGDLVGRGDGAPLLPRRIEGLRLVDCMVDGQMVRLTYDVRRGGG